MSCTHKFFGHADHLLGDQSLIPSWKVNTLIIGTFNPETIWHPQNAAQYFYGRTKNYLWKILPQFVGADAIPHADVAAQMEFLKQHNIGLTDLLIRINDAEIENPDHVTKIRTVLDDQIEQFNVFEWNTSFIMDYITNNDIQAIYFTKLGNPNQININPQTFEAQIREIENRCSDLEIPSYRLHTPSGNGLGAGTPKANNLIQRWYNHNGANHFPFLSADFNLNNFPVQQ